MRSSQKQQRLTSFFGGGTSSSGDSDPRQPGQSVATNPAPRRSKKRRNNGSHYGTCPICQSSIPWHRLESHASSCNGKKDQQPSPASPSTSTDKKFRVEGSKVILARTGTHKQVMEPTSEPIPGLFLFEDFVTDEKEREILAELDGTANNNTSVFLPWKVARFNGLHLGKRWGVHCNLRDRRVDAAEHPLPHFMDTIVCHKLQLLRGDIMKGCVPNEANAIDYHRKSEHYLKAHVDDRQLSKEPIANLSLAGDCYMTFQNVAPNRNTAVNSQKVLLKRRCLQVLTGKARYDFSHGIDNQDLLSDRRVSVTMRESPLTQPQASRESTASWWKNKIAPPPISKKLPCKELIPPTEEPLPGLFLFHDFITEEEEAIITKEIDGGSPPWSMERHTGLNRQKHWGIDHDLWSQDLRSPKHSLPSFLQTILLPRLHSVATMSGYVPNYVNAVDYCRSLGHSLGSHVDDRTKHKESIANLSLLGDCSMTYRNVQQRRNLGVPVQKVYLPRRCLQVMTGMARYDYAHGIENQDLLSERRVSVTMREIPFNGSNT